MTQEIRTISLFLVMLVLLIATMMGCKGIEEKPLATAEEIAQAAIQAMARLETYQFDTDYVDAVSREATSQTSVKMSIKGAGNEAGKRMRQIIHMSIEEQGVRSQTNMEIYLVGGWAYMKSDDDT